MFRLAVLLGVGLLGFARADEPPLSAETARELAQSFDTTIREATAKLAEQADDLSALSRRGDAYFFRGDFAKAVADYDRMAEIDPELADAHWRRGIACFYAQEYQRAAKQFERYHTFDDVDRENGIWRYFSQAKAYGIEKARANLLRYKKTDREPFPAVYRLFQGQTTPEEILEGIRDAQLDKTERNKRLFYAHLYVGLDHALHGRAAAAKEHLKKSTANPWPQTAGYGPQYMWHVGRVHLKQLAADDKARMR